MKLIKYHISKLKPPEKRIGKYNAEDIFEKKIVGFFGYLKHKKNDWNLLGIEYFIITRFFNSWRKINLSNKIAIIALIISSLIAVFFGILSYLSNKNLEQLDKDYVELKLNYNYLENKLLLTSDSLNKEKKKTEYLLLKLKSKKVSDIKKKS